MSTGRVYWMFIPPGYTSDHVFQPGDSEDLNYYFEAIENRVKYKNSLSYSDLSQKDRETAFQVFTEFVTGKRIADITCKNALEFLARKQNELKFTVELKTYLFMRDVLAFILRASSAQKNHRSLPGWPEFSKFRKQIKEWYEKHVDITVFENEKQVTDFFWPIANRVPIFPNTLFNRLAPSYQNAVLSIIVDYLVGRSINDVKPDLILNFIESTSGNYGTMFHKFEVLDRYLLVIDSLIFLLRLVYEEFDLANIPDGLRVLQYRQRLLSFFQNQQRLRNLGLIEPLPNQNGEEQGDKVIASQAAGNDQIEKDQNENGEAADQIRANNSNKEPNREEQEETRQPKQQQDEDNDDTRNSLKGKRQLLGAPSSPERRKRRKLIVKTNRIITIEREIKVLETLLKEKYDKLEAELGLKTISEDIDGEPEDEIRNGVVEELASEPESDIIEQPANESGSNMVAELASDTGSDIEELASKPGNDMVEELASEPDSDIEELAGEPGTDKVEEPANEPGNDILEEPEDEPGNAMVKELEDEPGNAMVKELEDETQNAVMEEPTNRRTSKRIQKIPKDIPNPPPPPINYEPAGTAPSSFEMPKKLKFHKLHKDRGTPLTEEEMKFKLTTNSFPVLFKDCFIGNKTKDYTIRPVVTLLTNVDWYYKNLKSLQRRWEYLEVLKWIQEGLGLPLNDAASLVEQYEGSISVMAAKWKRIRRDEAKKIEMLEDYTHFLETGYDDSLRDPIYG